VDLLYQSLYIILLQAARNVNIIDIDLGISKPHIIDIVLFSVDKTSYMVGSYGPKMELQSFTTPVDEAPSGLISRGTYNIKSLFTDDDKNEHLKWEWSLEIKKDWK